MISYAILFGVISWPLLRKSWPVLDSSWWVIWFHPCRDPWVSWDCSIALPPSWVLPACPISKSIQFYLIVEQIVLLYRQLGLMLQLLELIPLRMLIFHLHAIIILKNILLIRLKMLNFLDLVYILPYKLRVSHRFDLLFQQFNLFVFLAYCVF